MRDTLGAGESDQVRVPFYLINNGYQKDTQRI